VRGAQIQSYADEEKVAAAQSELYRARFKIELEQASNAELREKISKLEFELKARPVIKVPMEGGGSGAVVRDTRSRNGAARLAARHSVVNIIFCVPLVHQRALA
jgi:hypothetical protein